MIPNSCTNGRSKCGYLVETISFKLLKEPEISRSFVKIIVPRWPHPSIPILNGGISLSNSTEFCMILDAELFIPVPGELLVWAEL